MKSAFASASILLLYIFFGRTTAVEPINVSPSQQWDGSDGKWSSFALRVGTPAQTLRVFASTSATSTWVIADGFGCSGWRRDNCLHDRGQPFKSNNSGTWVNIGKFNAHVEENLGFKVNAEWGFDTVGLGFAGAGGPTLPNTTITKIADPNFLLGNFGLNPRPNNFTEQNEQNQTSSYLSLLHEQNLIPSLSYSYTAGAKYRQNGVLGSLILGGYDEGQFVGNGLSFPFFHDQERDLTVGLQAITSEDGKNKAELLEDGILTLIDSTVSQIWLPDAACKLFETTFGLVYDEETGYYLLTGRQHSKLLDQKPTITFTLGRLASGGQTVDIEIPYNAFDLNVSYPLVANSTYYFPLRKAANESQYTLGRTFLQEAYLTVDYGRQNFSVSQRNWDLNSKNKIVAIAEPEPKTDPGGNGTLSTNRTAEEKSGISTGAIAGIAIAAVALLVVIGLGIFFYRRRQQKRKAHELEGSGVPFPADPANGSEAKPDATYSNITSPMTSPGTPGNRSELAIGMWKPRELLGDHSFYGKGDVVIPTELSVQQSYSELDAHQDGYPYELEAPHGAQEISAVDEDIQRGDDGIGSRGHSDDPNLGINNSPIVRKPSPTVRKPVGGPPG